MDNDFKKMLEEQVRHSLIIEAIEESLLEYNLKEIPVGNSLYSCLEAYTKKNLIKLAEENGIDAKASWNKDPIIDSLYDGIMNTMLERFLLLGDNDTELLYEFSEGKFDTDKTSLKKIDFFLNVYPIAVRMGMIYSFDGINDVAMSIPLEVKASLEHFMSQNAKIKKEYQAKISALKKIEDSLNAAVHLYGVVNVDRIRALWEIQYPNAEYTLEFDEFFRKMIPLIAIKHNHYYIQYHLTANYRFADPEYAREFYNHVLGKMADDYYVPTKKEVQYYAQYPFNQHSSTYKKLRRFLSKLTPDIDLLLGFIEGSIQLGEPFHLLMQQIQELDLIFFDTEEQFFDFAELHTQLHNNTRLWENGGYTPNELFGQLTDSSFNLLENLQKPDNIIPLANYRNPADNKGQSQGVKKVGRNDPCPCGSGKKYKKCCWNK